MKLNVFGIVFLFSFFSQVYAQDIIITRNAEKIEAKILSVDRNTIIYTPYNNATNEAKTILKSQVATIAYENGDVETYNISAINHATDKSSATSANTEASSPQNSSNIENQNTPTNNNYSNYNKPIYFDKTLFAEKYPQAYDDYRLGKERIVLGIITNVIGVGLLGYGCVNIADANSLKEDNNNLSTKEKDEYDEEMKTGKYLLIAGGICIGIGIHFCVSGAAKRQKGVNEYMRNERRYSSYNEPIHLDLVSQKRGMGLALTF